MNKCCVAAGRTFKRRPSDRSCPSESYSPGTSPCGDNYPSESFHTTFRVLVPVPAATSGALMPAQGFMAPFKLATMTPADMASLAVFMASAQAAQAAPRQYRPDYRLTPANASIIVLPCLLTSLTRKLCPRLPGRGLEGWTCSYLRTI